jgi:hypothetical protein
MRSLSVIGSTDMSAAGLMTSFQPLSSSGSNGISTRDRFRACIVRPWVASRQRALTPDAPLRRFLILCLIPRDEHLLPQTEGRRFSTCSSSINRTFQVALLLRGYSTSASCDALSKPTSPRPTRIMLLLHLCSTSLWSAFRPSLRVCWSYLILVRSALPQATTAPCLHFKPLDLLSRSLMFAFVCAQEDFSSF